MDERAGAPAWFLLFAGVVNVLYSAVYFLWTLIPLAFSAMAAINAVVDGTQQVGQAIVSFLLLGGVPLIQLIGFGFTFVLGLLSILGGIRLNRYRSKGLVLLGAMSAVATPLICGLLNASSMFNLSALGVGCLTGCLFGNLPTLFTFVIGLVAGIWAGVTASASSEKFAWNG